VVAGRRAWSTALAISVAFTAAWSVDAATATTEGANLWPIGAVLTFIGTLLLTLLVARVTQRRTRKPVSAGDWP
jgi:membrane protein implicated in regulation of membrane protease activity